MFNLFAKSKAAKAETTKATTPKYCNKYKAVFTNTGRKEFEANEVYVYATSFAEAEAKAARLRKQEGPLRGDFYVTLVEEGVRNPYHIAKYGFSY